MIIFARKRHTVTMVLGDGQIWDQDSRYLGLNTVDERVGDCSAGHAGAARLVTVPL